MPSGRAQRPPGDDVLVDVLILAVGLVLLVIGAEWLVRGASRLAAAAGISPVVIGLTVVAFGTSSPELAVSVRGALVGQADVAVGNVVGSNGFNLLFILGVSAVAGALVVHERIVRLDVPLVIGATGLVWFLAQDGRLSRPEGVLLFALIVAYTGWLVRAARDEPAAIVEEFREALPPDGASVRAVWPRSVLFVVVGLALLVVGADRLVVAATSIASALGVSDLVIGLTIVAAGTSLPELATSVVAALRGERDIAVGNVVGSNLFNLLAVLGAAAIAAPAGLEVAAPILALDLPFTLAATVMLLPVVALGLRIERWEGAALVGLYAAYVVGLLTVARGTSDVVATRTPLLLGLVGVGAVLTAVGWRTLQRGRRAD